VIDRLKPSDIFHSALHMSQQPEDDQEYYDCADAAATPLPGGNAGQAAA